MDKLSAARFQDRKKAGHNWTTAAPGKNTFNKNCLIHDPWRGGRVVEGTGLENRQG